MRVDIREYRPLPDEEPEIRTTADLSSGEPQKPDTRVSADDDEIPGVFLLPSDRTEITQSARQIFRAIAPTHTLFVQGIGGEGIPVVELVRDRLGRATLKTVRPDEFCSRLERYGRKLMAWRVGRDGGPVLAERRCPEDTARKLLLTKEALELLPAISLVSRCAVLVEDNGEIRVAGPGYTPAGGGIFVTEGEIPPLFSVDRARELLNEIVADFDFASPGDRARALAAIITPALRMGGLMPTRTPIFVVEADQSQAGKGYLGQLTRAIYRSKGYVVTQRDGGVGGLDESLGQAILSGTPFVEIDNVRGRIDSKFFESALTNDGFVTVRVPHRSQVEVDASKITWSMTSNGAEATQDLSNRACITRIRKRPKGYQFRRFAEGDVLRHTEANQSLYLGAVLSICREWLKRGRPRTDECRHDFREWAQSLDWIVQKLLGAGPLMEGHEAAQQRVANPFLGWLRTLALAIVQGGREPDGWTASKLLDLCETEGIEVPGTRGLADEKAVGRALARCFIDADAVEIDDMVVTRRCYSAFNPKARKDEPRKDYRFERLRDMRGMRDGVTTPWKSVAISEELHPQPAHPANEPAGSPEEMALALSDTTNPYPD